MIQVSVLYPNDPAVRFDMDYYINSHIPLIKEKLGAACSNVTFQKGVSGLPGTPAPYGYVCNIFSPSMDEFLNAFGLVSDQLNVDVSNFTDLQPTLL